MKALISAIQSVSITVWVSLHGSAAPRIQYPIYYSRSHLPLTGAFPPREIRQWTYPWWVVSKAGPLRKTSGCDIRWRGCGPRGWTALSHDGSNNTVRPLHSYLQAFLLVYLSVRRDYFRQKGFSKRYSAWAHHRVRRFPVLYSAGTPAYSTAATLENTAKYLE